MAKISKKNRKIKPDWACKIRDLIDQGITMQRDLAQATGLSLPTINTYCQWLAKRKKEEEQYRELIALETDESGQLVEKLFKRACLTLYMRLPDIPDTQLQELILQLAALVKK